MSEMAKKARAAMKSKADRLGSSRPLERVDFADWTPPELLNADVKTGLRPVSKRQFKKGGKVTGEACKARADRKPRKSGGRAITANSLVNRNVKEANEERDGIKHVGGMKKGGRAKKNVGGESMPLPVPRPKSLDAEPPVDKKKVEPGDAASRDLNRMMEIQRQEDAAQPRKAGGRSKKMIGGPMAGAEESMKKARETAGVPSDVISSVPAQSRFSKTAGLKKGGRADKAGGGMLEAAKRAMMLAKNMPRKGTRPAPLTDQDKQEATLRDQGDTARKYAMARKKGGKVHEDEAMDKALIKKMVKPEARKGKNIGGMLGGLIPMAIGAMSGKDKDEKKHGGRTARKAGGRAKGKTNINIIIAAGKPQGQGMGGMQPADAPMQPAGLPVPVPPPQGAQGGMPMPMPMPMPAPAGGAAGGPPGMPPMGRKAGGRISKVAKSYKDMTAGAGSGEGRLQKTDIAKRGAHKAGGKVYRSYKDMDAGAGSGFGRLEKTEIQARKK